MINFIKMHGLGNDYIYFDLIQSKLKLDNISNFIKHISDRNFGIGGDGVVLIDKSDTADFNMRMFNSDGTEGNMCGNAIRCVAKYIFLKKYTSNTKFTISTKSGNKLVFLNLDKDQNVESVKVDMGKPSFLDGSYINLKSNPRKKLESIVINDKIYNFIPISVGNPHCVIFNEELNDYNVKKIGALIEKNPLFGDGVNVEFVKILDKNTINMRVWERGSGETLACGTGACASAIACKLAGLTENHVEVHLKGGILQIYLDPIKNTVYMEGPAKIVFQGTLSNSFLEEIINEKN